MKKKTANQGWHNLLHIYTAAAASDDGERCMIAPSPAVREQFKKELKKLKAQYPDDILSNLLTPRQRRRVGLNDGLIIPGKIFPLGTSVAAVKKNAVQRAPLRGALRVVVVLVEFPDKKLSFDKQHYEDLFFSTGVIPTGSVNEYYQEVSGGLISITGEVEGPYTLPQTLATYAGGASGLSDNEPNARTMAQDAAIATNADIDFSLYDNDRNGYVDAFVVIHAGRGAEETTGTNDIWSHKWILPEEFDADGTRIYGYLTVPEDCKLGVCAHELGHLLFGFPDLYDSDYDSSGIGNWCLMAAGSWNNQGHTPAHPCAWCKLQQNWVNTVTPTGNLQQVTIPPVISDNTIYRLWKDGGPGNEYFLLENRQQQQYDQYLPAAGLLIWHIDDDMADNDNSRHYKVALMQADGKNDLEKGNNEGDAGDCWPGTSNNTRFTATSIPSSLSYGQIDTQVQVTEIQQQNEIITARIAVTSDAETKGTS